jgi:glycerophosphoryl diester phosphodiesterase
MPPAEKQKLADLAKRTHERGRKLRFWATPEKEAVWAELLAAGVDYINTDKLDELQKFLQANARER